MNKGNFNFLNGVCWRNVSLFLLFVAVLAAATRQAQAQTNSLNIDELPKLESGRTIEREIKSGEGIFFAAKLRRGEALRVDGEEFEANLTLVLATPALEPLAVGDFGLRFDRETVSYVAENADENVLLLVKAEKGPEEKSKFRLTPTIKIAGDADKQRVAVGEIQMEAYDALQHGTPESFAAARDGFERAAKIWNALGENYWEAYSLNFAGMALVRLGKNSDALPFLNSALPLWKAAGAKRGEADTNGVLAGFYFQAGENRRATEGLKTALDLVRAVGDRQSEINYMQSLSSLYQQLGEREKWAAYTFAADLRSKQDARNTSTMLGEMGIYQKSFGNFLFALETDSLALDYAGDDKESRAQLLGDIADIYLSLERFSDAADTAALALKLNGEIENKTGVAISLARLAEANLKSGELAKAREYAEKSLALISEVDDRATRAGIFNTAGEVYNFSGEAEKALPFLKNALFESKAAGVNLFEADALENLMLTEKALKNNRLAAFYGKQAVNILQIQRSTLKSFDEQKNANFGSLDRSIQKAFLKSAEKSYKKLAEVLIENDRLPEAHEVLVALKDQQFLDFDAGETKTKLAPLSATAREAAGSQKFTLAGKTIADLSWKLRGYSYEEQSEKNKAEAALLEKQLDAAVANYKNVLKEIETNFAEPLSEKDKAPAIAAMRDLQATLRETDARTQQKSAAIYQLVGDEKFSALVVTADGITKTVTPANGKNLEQKALQFWALLQSPTYDPTKISQEIYQIVFKPLEAKLPADTRTLLWVADGNLRYVPPAALFDGKKYLVERFNHVAFTRRAADGKKTNVTNSPRWTGTGFGSAAAHTVELNDERISFAALTGVTDELNKIFTAKDKVLTGAVFADAKFTKANFLAALKLKRAVVHVASHFSFRAGDESNSFLLMGDGSALTLAEMKKQPKLFDGVELLTLSACNTAAQQTGANGREIDGFAELAQRLGAGAVMATLWSVADNSTPALMREFYRLKLDKNLSKAEALRQSQLALLSGASQAKPVATRSDLSPVEIVLTESPNAGKISPENTRSKIVYLGKQDAPAWDKSKHPPFAHPFFWSPFVLFGNWQ